MNHTFSLSLLSLLREMPLSEEAIALMREMVTLEASHEKLIRVMEDTEEKVKSAHQKMWDCNSNVHRLQVLIGVRRIAASTDPSLIPDAVKAEEEARIAMEEASKAKIEHAEAERAAGEPSRNLGVSRDLISSKRKDLWRILLPDDDIQHRLTDVVSTRKRVKTLVEMETILQKTLLKVQEILPPARAELEAQHVVDPILGIAPATLEEMPKMFTVEEYEPDETLLEFLGETVGHELGVRGKCDE